MRLLPGDSCLLLETTKPERNLAPESSWTGFSSLPRPGGSFPFLLVLTFLGREITEPVLQRIWVFLWGSAGCLAGERGRVSREGDVAPGPLCPVLCGPRSHDPHSVNGLSKDNFCFSFAVGSCPAASNEKCAFSRDSGAGDLCGNRPHPRGPGCSDRPTGGGWGPAWKRTWCPGFCSARFKGALQHPYLQDTLQRLPWKPRSLSR